MALHLKGCVELFVAMFTLCDIGQIYILLLLRINVALHMHHDPHVVVQHLVAVPTLQLGQCYIRFIKSSTEIYKDMMNQFQT